MSEQSTDPQIVTLEPTTVAVVRETVAMNGLPGFFARAFHTVAAATEHQGVAIVGPPLGVYYGMPSDTVDVAAGFPIDRPVQAEGVKTETLPGGPAAQILHVGPYDAMVETYGRLMAWLAEQGLTAGGLMWETYLNDPSRDSVQTALTRITWPLAN